MAGTALSGWMSRNHYQESDPGITWIKDEAVVIDLDDLDASRVLTPNVVVPPDGSYRLYYYSSGAEQHKEAGSAGYVASAVSADGSAWTKEGMRLEVHAPDAEKRVLCPDVISLPDGSYRMYFQACSERDCHVVLSAASQDGIHWTREPGIRFADADSNFGSPRCLPLEDGRFRLYCHEYPLPFNSGLDAGNHIVSAVSANGHDFKREPGVRIPQEIELESYAVYAPEVLRLGDGTYRMYYAGWSEDPVEGRIFSAVSADGLEWVKEKGICLDNGGRYQEVKVSEPCIARLADGRFRMFYEACDTGGTWRILSATTPG